MDFIDDLKDGYSTLKVTRNQRIETEVLPYNQRKHSSTF